MSVIIQGTELREISLGRYVQGKTSTIGAGGGTFQLFTVAGGEVLITALWGKVTTAITLATEGVAIQTDPTTGDTVVVAAGSTDLGTTDTAAGTILGVDGDGSSAAVIKGGKPLMNLVVSTGEIEATVADVTGTEDGVIEWYCTWVPLTPGATVVASA